MRRRSGSLDGFVAGSCPRRPPARAASSSAVGSSTWSTGRKVGAEGSGYGAGKVGKPAFVVVTGSPPESVPLTDLDRTFLPGVVTAAHERAEAADSGNDLDVVLMRGGATISSAPDAGLVDTPTLHLLPVVLGAGTRWCSGV
jgi:dihydrofolate reductase